LCFATEIAGLFGHFAKCPRGNAESKLVTFTLIVYILTFSWPSVKMANLKSGRFCQKGRDFSQFHGNPAAFGTIFRLILEKIKWIRRFARATGVPWSRRTFS
jgi:hypothetical protein